MKQDKYAVRVSKTDLRTGKIFDKDPFLYGPFECESEANDYALHWVEETAKRIGKPYKGRTESEYDAIAKDVVVKNTIVRLKAETMRMEEPDWDAVLPPETMEMI